MYLSLTRQDLANLPADVQKVLCDYVFSRENLDCSHENSPQARVNKSVDKKVEQEIKTQHEPPQSKESKMGEKRADLQKVFLNFYNSSVENQELAQKICASRGFKKVKEMTDDDLEAILKEMGAV